MTSNKLPKVLRKPKRGDKEEDWEFIERFNDYMAFQARCKIVEMKKSHSNKEEFPYTTDILAIYMKCRMNKRSPPD